MHKLKTFLFFESYWQAVLLLHLAYCFHAITNCITHYTVFSINPITIAFYRTLFSLIFSSVAVLTMSDRTAQLKQFNRVNIGKSFFDSINMVAMILVAAYVPLAQAASIQSLAVPLFSAIIAALYLKDKMPCIKWVACLLATFGILINFIATNDKVNFYLIFAVVTSICLASINMTTKRLLATQKINTIIFYSNLLRLLILLPFFLVFGETLSEADFYILIYFSGFAYVSNIILMLAQRKTTASNLIPYDYTRIVIAAVFAYFFIGQVPVFTAIISSIIIIIAIYWLQFLDLTLLARIRITIFSFWKTAINGITPKVHN